MSDINLACSLNRGYIPTGKGQKLFLKIELTPTAGMVTESLPVNVCLLIDRSGSMAGKKLDNAKEGAIRLVDQLESKDYCGVVTFESKVDVVVSGTHVADKSMFEKKIQKIGLGGSTEMYKGLETAFDELERPLRTHYSAGDVVRRVILLSDGQPTDNKSESDYRGLARNMRGTGISITALGIGADYNEDLLSAIAEDSGGTWHHITSPDKIPHIFSKELTSMKTVVFSRPELVIRLSEGVELADVHKSKPDVHRISNIMRTENEYRMPIGDIKAGESQTIVARIGVPPRPEGECRVAQVTVTSGAFSKSENVLVYYTANESLWSETDPYSRTLFAVTETQIKAKDGLSGDKTALRQAATQLKTLLKDPTATQVKDIADRTVVLEDVLSKTTKFMSEEEKKEAKSDLTKVKR